MAESVRVEIGFIGGGSTTATLSSAVWKALHQAVDKAAEGTVELETEAGSLYVRVNQVAFLRTHAKESRVGF